MVVVLLAVGLTPRPALGHKDYEHAVGTTRRSDGRSLNMVLHYTDGIIVIDPVKLVLYDSSNIIVAETPYYRDVLVYTNAAGEVYVFAHDAWSIFFRRAWQVDGDNLVPVKSPTLYGYAVLAAVQTHWLGYLISMGLLSGGVWILCFAWRRARFLSRLGAVLLSFGAIWGMQVLIYDYLSVPLILLLTMILTGPCWVRIFRTAMASRAQRHSH